MSSAFDDLFSAFKGGNESSSNTKPKGESLAGARLPLTGEASRKDADADLDAFFGSKTSNATSGTARDEFDLAFDMLNGPVASRLAAPDVDLVEPKPQPVVDEVKDMEIARLMSLGLDWDKAAEYYERGILYEQVVDRQKRRTARTERPLRTSPQSSQLREEESDLFSVASNWLNKGRTFLDSKLKQVQTEYSDRSFSDYISSRSGSNASPPWLKESGSYHLQVSSDRGKQKVTTQFKDLKIEEETHFGPRANSPVPSTKSPAVSVASASHPVYSETPGDKSEAPPNPSPVQDNDLLIDFEAPALKTSNVPATYSPNLTELERHSFEEFKEKGANSFRTGDYHAAFQNYEKSLNSLPLTHPLRVVSFSNIIICRLKVGEYREALSDASSALKLIPQGSMNSNIPNLNPPKTYKEFWSKIMNNKAVAFERVENYEKALETYQQLIEAGVTSSKVLEARRQCQKAIALEKKPVSVARKSETSIPKAAVTKKPSGRPAKVTLENPSEKLARVQDINKKEKDLEAQRFLLHDEVSSLIQEWCEGHDDNLRELLARFHTIVDWVNWKEVSTADLVVPKKAKVIYLKAVAKTHPDKIQDSWPLKRKMIAENVFIVLSKAWETFKEKNQLS
ncbi:auxilin-like protein SWA2 [Lachancea thermotolerans CBS 6340]|uniref:KLTH0H14872p n=1 Tax=Lachancea thermotolerans (strain ATCC 56472 / CBS 6340 / NRRL Y-8284) TaxID=559295 RepID=C5E3M8_LACTC|nr:KLTH0H14872p [Lachancea thermotolerans CBS 6340]CAR30639.1 KLTH0H14872p [Lachancea thermotolerans CBS 6340]